MARIRHFIQPLPEPQARAYWQYIRQNGLLLEYQGHPIQYGHPFVLERSQAEEMAKAADVAEAIVRDEITWSMRKPINVGKIQEALYNCINSTEHELYPFGFAPVVVQ